MKGIKGIAYMLLVLTLIFSLFACNDGDCEHADADNDGLCDECGETLSSGGGDDKIVLVKDGVAEFQIVRASGLPTEVLKAIGDFTELLEDAGIDVTLASDKANGEITTEILVGDVKSREDKYKNDMYTLGMEGHLIKAVDNKIIIQSGDYSTLANVFKRFVSEYLGIDEDSSPDELQNISVDKTLADEKIQDDYRITDILIAGKSLRGSFIAVDDDASEEISEAALKLQKLFYERAGIYLPLRDFDDVTEDELKSAVIVREVENAGNGGFRINVKDNALLVETEFRNVILEQLDKFIAKEITPKRGDITLSKNFSQTANVRNIYYNDFGAVGNGITDDFAALKAAHDYANTYGHTVCAGDSKGNTKYSYYIGNSGTSSIIIKTDTKWGYANIIIDDSKILPSDPASTTPTFLLEPDHQPRNLSADELAKIKNSEGGIDKTVTKLNFEPGYPMMLTVYNSNHKVYIRYGANANSGNDQHELVLIDGEGNLDPTTPFLFDYDAVTKIVAYRIDDEPITVSGGIITSIANAAPRKYTYYHRNITVSRSNVTIDGLEHKITGEGNTGAPYTGFINFRDANNLRVQNSILQAHKTYVEEEAPFTNMGSYDISGGNANGLYFYNCTQSNFFKEGSTTEPSSGYWGIMGTNYCKNITYEKSRLSRLDAHAGVYNATIIDSEVKTISLIGGGLAKIKNSKIYANTVITLRSDYGSLWDGDIDVENLTIVTGSDYITLVSITYNNHDFGYPVTFTDKISFKNISVEGGSKPPRIVLFSNSNANFDFTKDRVPLASKGDEDKDANGNYKNLNPITLPEEITLIGFDAYLSSFKISDNEFLVEKYKNKIQYK